jgi:hypothetical protein
MYQHCQQSFHHGMVVVVLLLLLLGMGMEVVVGLMAVRRHCQAEKDIFLQPTYNSFTDKDTVR